MVKLYLVQYENGDQKKFCFGEHENFQEASKVGTQIAKKIMGENYPYGRFWMETEGLWEDFGHWSKFLLYEGATLEDLC